VLPNSDLTQSNKGKEISKFIDLVRLWYLSYIFY